MSTIAPAQTGIPAEEHLFLQGVSYPTYDALVTEVGDHRSLRFTFHRSELEIMSPSHDHERTKTLFGRMIEVITEELNLPVLSCGSTTFKDALREAGLEADESYYIQHEAEVRGRKLKLGEDPPPDLAIEINVTTSALDRLAIYAVLGFPEIWQHVNGEVVIHLLQATGEYKVAAKSAALPTVPVKKLVEQLERCYETDETTWIRAFRQWVRGGMN